MRRVGSNRTSLALASLRSNTSYTITVSAHTARGEGPTSDPVEATTRACEREREKERGTKGERECMYAWGRELGPAERDGERGEEGERERDRQRQRQRVRERDRQREGGREEHE